MSDHIEITAISPVTLALAGEAFARLKAVKAQPIGDFPRGGKLQAIKAAIAELDAFGPAVIAQVTRDPKAEALRYADTRAHQNAAGAERLRRWSASRY